MRNRKVKLPADQWRLAIDTLRRFALIRATSIEAAEINILADAIHSQLDGYVKESD